MTIDLDALEAARNEADEEKVADVLGFLILARNALPELIRLARIGQRVERDAKEEG